MADLGSLGDDATLLETMFVPYFTKYDRHKAHELDLSRILSSQVDELKDDTNEDYLFDSKTDEPSLQVLFSKSVSSKRNFADNQQSIEKVQSSSSVFETIEDAGIGDPRKINRCPFIQTRNENYRTVMEELMLIKCCSSQILENLENTKVVLEQYVEVKNDPGFGRVHVTQAWVWILKEAVASLICTDEKVGKKSLYLYLENLLLDLEKSFTQLSMDIKNLKKSFGKVWGESEALTEMAMERFRNNLESASEYELKTSGYNFFFNWKCSADSLKESVTTLERDDTKNGTHKCGETSQRQSLQVRCSVDGVTIHTEEMGTSWLKFQRVSQEKDKVLLLNVFVIKMTDLCTKVRESITLVNALLVHNFFALPSSSQCEKKFNDSILQSIMKCQDILDMTQSQVNFLPKEEVAMLYSLKTTTSSLKLIKPLLTEFSLSTDMQLAAVQDLSKQRKQLKRGHIFNRFPKLLNSRFELFIEDTKVNTDIMYNKQPLNRYPNIIEAKQLREKLLHMKSFNVDDLVQRDTILEETPVETLYMCAPEQFFTPSTQEIIDMFRTLISEQRNVINPNPAYYLFSDVTQEYVRLTKELTTTRTITPEIISLCSDVIRNFYKEAVELSSSKDKMLAQIVYATQKLTYTKSGNDVASVKRVMPLSSWIQVLCKTMHVWDFHSLPKALQNNFRSTNEVTMKWTAKLEESFREISKLVKQHKEEFYQFHDFIQANHGFITWVRKSFNFNPPNEILSKSYHEPQEDEDSNENVYDPIMMKNDDTPKLQLHFHDFEMSVVYANSKENSVAPLLSLNKSSGTVQIGIVTSLFVFIDQVVSDTVVHLNSAKAIHDKHISLSALKKTLSKGKDYLRLNQIHQLEDTVLALTFEMVRKDLNETVAYMGLLNTAISQFNRLLQAVQLHLEDRGMLRDDSELPIVSKERNKLSETGLYRRHDKYLSETIQLLNTSVESMPNVFEVQPETLVYSLYSWAKIANKDDKLTDKVSPEQSDVTKSMATNECVNRDGEFWPINFEEAMTLTTTGKAFFPDPVQFSSNTECWRSICFKMLSAALDKFREMTNTKISDAKTVLSIPLVGYQENSGSSVEHSASKTSVGYTEGIGSILCYVTEQLIPRDRFRVSKSDIKLLKESFATVNDVVRKFKKRLEATERVLVNSLSLCMANVEHKRLPEYLPVLPQEDDFLKSHDLEEVGSSSSSTAIKNDKHKYSRTLSVDTNNACNLARENDLLHDDNYVELQWDSVDRHKLMCKSHGNGDSAWLQFSQLHIIGQLHIIHLLIDELKQEFGKATTLMSEAKEDILCAKKLLVRTWKGIGKDFKKRLIPGSGIVVLLKLYRHQVATAVLNVKAIRETTAEVQYLLTQSLEHSRQWIENRSGVALSNKVPGTDNHMASIKDFSFSLTLKTPPAVTQQEWLFPDEDKINDQMETEDATVQTLQETDNKNVCELKEAVLVKSSTSLLFNPKQMSYDTDNNSISGNKVNTVRLSVVPVKENGMLKRGNDKFSSVAASIQNMILSGLVQSVAILKLPNCVTNALVPTSMHGEKPEVTNLMGVLTTLVAVSVDIRSYKDVMPQQKDTLRTKLTLVERKISNMLNKDNGLVDTTHAENEKMIRELQALDANFRSKFTFAGEYPPIKEIPVAPVQPSLGITPIEFVEGLAATLKGHVWTIICGIPDIGTVMKSNKTLESHAVANIPLLSKLEVQLSIVDYLDKIMLLVQSSLTTNKEEIATAKTLLKSRIKLIISTSYNKGAFGLSRRRRENTFLGRSEVHDILNGLSLILCACTKAQEHLSYISNVLSEAHEVLQQVVLYVNLKIKLEPTVGEESNGITRVKWQTVDQITGITGPARLRSPVIHKKTVKRKQKQQVNQIKYKDVWEDRIFELEIFFDYYCKRHHISVDIPIAFAPTFTTAGNE